MNKDQRARLEKIKELVQYIIDELTESMENIPEQFEDKVSTYQSQIDDLDEANDSIEQAINE
jgi:vacuolar-type H+-ATPase subunit E/Vma4